MSMPPDEDRTAQIPAQRHSEPAPPPPREQEASFDELIDHAVAESSTPQARYEEPTQWEDPPEEPVEQAPVKKRATWVLPVVTVALVGLGLVAVGAGLGNSYFSSGEPEPADPWAEVAIPSMPEEAGGADPARFEEDSTGVSELVDLDWVAATSETSHISESALAAYAGATLLANDTFPECNLGWNTLAAIGYVETQHGSYGGARIRDDGIVHPTIVGPRLDGGEGVAEILDTDGGELDGDTEYDRAVGPMQFIPATWEEFGQDGSGDGHADINNIEDAALSAAVYLCSYGDMTQEENWIDAIDAYNPSLDYNHEVADRAAHYGNFG